MRGNPVEGETRRQRTTQAPQSFHGRFPAAITADLKLARTSNPNLYLIASLEFERIHYRRRQTNGEAVSPFGYLHR
jgi:hypothetical protein